MDKETVNMDTMPLRWGHFRVLLVASLGQMTGAGMATLIGIILPLMQLFLHPELSSGAQGAIGCTGLVGIMIGSLLFGRLSDEHGYLFFFRFCPALVLTGSLLAFWSDGLTGLIIGLFIMGVGVGGAYSLDSDYISELMPKKWRLLMVGVAKAFSAVGNILVALLCFFLLKEWNDPLLWNHLLLLITGITGLMLLTRIRFTQSPGWLIAHGRIAEAETAVRYFLGSDVVIGELRARPLKRKKGVRGSQTDTPPLSARSDAAAVSSSEATYEVSWSDLLRRTANRRRVILSAIPWACEGVSVYGVGIFTPLLIMALGLSSDSPNGFDRVLSSVEVTAGINLFILFGFIIGLSLVNRWQHLRMQTGGFLLATAGLLLLWAAYRFHLPTAVAVIGFMAFQLFLNAGPHLTTFILPAQIYSVAERGSGTGLAASAGKLGAVIGVLFIPLLLAWGGVELVLLVVMLVNLTGALVTWLVGREVFHPLKHE
ncbi:MAG: MFS transporter [Bacteroides sp.]|uniref:MFS transporter n=1 Tax=Bacteroides sp. TaxID=29523 RepID=UPI002FCBC621